MAEQKPDSIVLYFSMPELDGFGVMARLREAGEEYPPILVGDLGTRSPPCGGAASRRARATSSRPYDEIEIRLRVGNLLTSWLLLGACAGRTTSSRPGCWSAPPPSRTRTTRSSSGSPRRPSSADDDTGEHIRRVGELAGALAVKLGLDASLADLFRRAAPLHDVGKIASNT